LLSGINDILILAVQGGSPMRTARSGRYGAFSSQDGDKLASWKVQGHVPEPLDLHMILSCNYVHIYEQWASDPDGLVHSHGSLESLRSEIVSIVNQPKQDLVQ